MVDLKNCEPELSHTLAELFIKCLKESYFPDCWKVSLVVPVFKNVGEGFTAKNYRHMSLLSVVLDFFEPLVLARSVLRSRICPSFCPGIVSFFSKFWHDARNPCEVVCDSRIFQKNYFCPKN